MVNGNSALYFAAAAYGIYSNKESQKYQNKQQAQKQQKIVSRDFSFRWSTEGKGANIEFNMASVRQTC